MVATQELEAGDALRRFKAEVSQDEPRRGNNTNRHIMSTSARCLEIVTIYGIFLTCVGVLWYMSVCLSVCLCVLVCAVFSCDVLCFCTRQGNGICLLVVGSPSWKRVQLLN